MKTILFFDNQVCGHHLEYLNHLYKGACRYSQFHYIFAVPKQFDEVKSKLDWNAAEHIDFVYLSDKDVRNCSARGYISQAWGYSRVLRKYCLQYGVDELFLITMPYPFPLFPLFCPKGTKVSGIMYRLYLYEWKSLPWTKRIKDVIENWVQAKAPCVRCPLVLNDSSAAAYFNHLYKVSKYKPIVDPVLPLAFAPKNIRNELNIPKDDTVFYHFGAMNKRKGTLMIMDSLTRLSQDDLKGKTFIFAGKIGADIRSEFYRSLDALSKYSNILVYDKFCPYELLANLCISSDYILAPYSNVSYSSGIIGYASQFEKCVITPAEGLLGKLVKRNHLGVTIPQMDETTLSEAIRVMDKHSIFENGYAQKNCIDNFIKQVFEIWNY